MLAVDDLTVWRGNSCLFDGLSFELPAQRALLLMGPNGSGKTTLLRIIAGLARAESGSVRWHGRTFAEHLRAGQSALVYLGHASGLKSDLTVVENIAFFARLQAADPARLPQLIDRCGLAGCEDIPVRYLSAGQRRRAALARLLLNDAPLWLLDEPLTNLDAAGRIFVNELITTHLGAGGSAVLATHGDLSFGAHPVDRLMMGTP